MKLQAFVHNEFMFNNNYDKYKLFIAFFLAALVERATRKL